MKLFVVALAAATTGVGAVEIPQLPDGFSSTIEAVITNKNYSTTIREIYDQENDRMRIDRQSREGRQTEICDLSHSTHLIVTRNESGTSCESKTIDSCFIARQAKDGHLPRASDMLQQVKATEYTHLPNQVMRGIRCDVWKSAEVSHASRRSPDMNTTYTLEWAFQTEDWGFDHNNNSVPVAVILKGYHVNTTDMQQSGEFEHTYNFIEFYSTHDQHAMGNPDNYFEIQPSFNCMTTPTTTTTKTQTLKCGEGTEAKDGECVCKVSTETTTTKADTEASTKAGASNESTTTKADTETTTTKADTGASTEASATTSGGRGLMQTVYDTAVNWGGFVPGILAGFTLGQ